MPSFFWGPVRHAVRAFQGHLVCQAHLKSRDYGAAVCDAALVLQTRNDAKATRGLVESWSHCNAFCWSVAAHAAPGLGQIQPSLERPLIRFMNSSFWADESQMNAVYFYLFHVISTFGCPGRSYQEQKVLSSCTSNLNISELCEAWKQNIWHREWMVSSKNPLRLHDAVDPQDPQSQNFHQSVSCWISMFPSMRLKWDQAEVMEWRAVTKAAVKAAIDYAAQGSGGATPPLWKGWEDLEGPLNLRKVEMSKCQTIWVKLLFYIVYCINIYIYIYCKWGLYGITV